MKRYITGLIAVTIGLAACEKTVAPVDDFAVTVEFRNSVSKALTSDITLNPKDSIYLDFTITSADQDMSYVEIQKNGIRIDTFQLAGQANKRSFSKVKGYMADSAAGDYTYRVLARNSRAVFIGDGEKAIKVTINPDFNFWSYRILQVPDTVAKTNKTYYSTLDGKTYSYSDGAANSARIDFGYYFDTTGRSTPSTTDDLGHTFYSLDIAQPQLSFYDISTWTKKATIFKKMPISPTAIAVIFNNLTSAGAINTFIKNQMTAGTSSKVTALSLANTGSTSNSIIGFKTAEGKFGVIQVRFFNGNTPSKETQIEVDVKVQK